MPFGVPLDITHRDVVQHIADGVVVLIHLDVIQAFAENLRRFLANDAIPERRVGSVAIRCILAVNGVRQRAIPGKTPEGDEQLFHLLHHAGREQSARANKRIAAPIKKPRISGDDGETVIAPHHKRPRGTHQLTSKYILFRKNIFGAEVLVRRWDRGSFEF